MGSDSKIYNTIEVFLNGCFKNRMYFACVYGSHAYNNNRRSSSDIDIFISSEKFESNDFGKIKKFIVDIHEKLHLDLDEEVPYKNKLLVKYDEVQKSVHLLGFKLVNNRYQIPKIIKSKRFLASNQVKLRLLLNALTSPHIFLGNDYDSYLSFRRTAERNLLFLCFDLKDCLVLKKSEILETLLKGKNGESGEMYLGYKKENKVIDYLSSTLIGNLPQIISKGEISMVEDSLVLHSWKIVQEQKDRFLKLQNSFCE